jgi:hypothetical protein
MDDWNGSAWSIEPIPWTDKTNLNAISCSSASTCTVVGVSDNFDALGHEIPLIGRWDGRGWSPQTGQPQDGPLNAVSCPSATACVAVGSTAESESVPLAQHWNGQQWTTDNSFSVFGVLDNVSCASRQLCFAVGSSSSPAVIARWNGIRWTAHTPSRQLFEDVSCSARACIAAGGTDGGRPLIARWNGVKWSPQPLQGPKYGDMTAISCTSTVSCVAVGNDANGDLIAARNGPRPRRPTKPHRSQMAPRRSSP